MAVCDWCDTIPVRRAYVTPHAVLLLSLCTIPVYQFVCDALLRTNAWYHSCVPGTVVGVVHGIQAHRASLVAGTTVGHAVRPARWISGEGTCVAIVFYSNGLKISSFGLSYFCDVCNDSK